MSNHRNNSDNDPLKKLLHQVGITETSAMDDFETEALEGFALLENQKDVLELKSNLDKKIYSKVLVKAKHSTHKYWLATAALLIFIGFSIYFVRTSNTELKNLAIVSEPNANDLMQMKEEIKVENKNVDQAFKLADSSSSLQKNNSISLKITTEENSEAMKEIQRSLTKDDFSRSNIMNEKSESSKSPYLTSDKKPEQDYKKKATTYHEVEHTIATALNTVNTKPAAAIKMNHTVSGALVQAVITSQELSFNPSVTYIGGDEALIKDVKSLLTLKKISKTFNVTLFIDNSGKVKKCIFTKTFNLTKEDQVEIMSVLELLDKFVPASSIPSKNLLEYNFLFIP